MRGVVTSVIALMGGVIFADDAVSPCSSRSKFDLQNRNGEGRVSAPLRVLCASALKKLYHEKLTLTLSNES